MLVTYISSDDPGAWPKDALEYYSCVLRGFMREEAGTDTQVLDAQKPIEEIAAEQGRSVVEYRDVALPPLLGARNSAPPQVRQHVLNGLRKVYQRREATKRTLEWMTTFPRAHTFPNFFAARQLLHQKMAPDQAPDLAAWLRTAPEELCFENTALRGCPPPEHARLVS